VEESDTSIILAAWREFSEETYGSFKEYDVVIKEQMREDRCVFASKNFVAAFVIDIPYFEERVLNKKISNWEIMSYHWVKPEDINGQLDGFHRSSRRIYEENEERILEIVNNL